MKKALIPSLLMNAILAGLLFFSPAAKRRNEFSPSRSIQVQETPLPAAATLAARVERGSFQWSQIESTNYRTYIANLEQIGCPAQTIRDIIRADVHSLYESRRGLSKQNLSSRNAVERVVAEEALAELNHDELALTASLLGVETEAADRSLPGVAPTVSRTRRQAYPVALPLVIQNVDLSTLKLNADQIQAINDLRQWFIDAIGGPGQDPQDPAYLQRWQEAQPEIDSMLRGMIGQRAWGNYQIAVWANAHGQGTTPQ